MQCLVLVSPFDQSCHNLPHYMKGSMRDNLCIVKRFSDTVRYIDDLLTLNNNSFEEEIINIYPPELTLEKNY